LPKPFATATAHLLLGEEIFTNAKVRKALDKLFDDQDESLVRLIRKTIGDDV